MFFEILLNIILKKYLKKNLPQYKGAHDSRLPVIFKKIFSNEFYFLKTQFEIRYSKSKFVTIQVVKQREKLRSFCTTVATSVRTWTGHLVRSLRSVCSRLRMLAALAHLTALNKTFTRTYLSHDISHTKMLLHYIMRCEKLCYCTFLGCVR